MAEDRPTDRGFCAAIFPRESPEIFDAPNDSSVISSGAEYMQAYLPQIKSFYATRPDPLSNHTNKYG